MSEILELYASSDDPEWAAQEENITESDNDDLYDLAVLHLERERQLGAARSDLAGMLSSAESFLTIRERILSGSMLQEKKDQLLALAKTSVEENCLEIPPLSAFITSISSQRKVSATCQRIGYAFTLLLLSAAPQTTDVNTTLLSDKVKMILCHIVIICHLSLTPTIPSFSSEQPLLFSLARLQEKVWPNPPGNFFTPGKIALLVDFFLHLILTQNSFLSCDSVILLPSVGYFRPSVKHVLKRFAQFKFCSRLDKRLLA